jgi:dihydrofolate synthase/folylpolyglutamate synthase
MLLHSIALYKRLQKYYSRKINLDLVRIQKVLTALSFPHLELDSLINILGSDGKMSTLTSLKYFLEAHKKKITAFTSPHLYDVRQRFWLKNRYITLKEIKKYSRIIEGTGLRLTLFELLTCIYILAAKKQKIYIII